MNNRYKNIYFLGIGGIGMSAIANYFIFNKNKVAGYDRVRSANCIKLENKGAKIIYEDNLNLLPKEFNDKESTLIVLTPAIPQNNTLLKYFKDNNFNILKRAEVLGIISETKETIAVAGTHGKTSVSSITSWIMSNSKYSCNAFLGGISKNFNSNTYINPDSKYAVVEADEFDRSFLSLNPKTALITSIEPDHLDIYNDFETLKQGFIDFTKKIKDNGHLILNNKIEKDIFQKELQNVSIFNYGIDDSKANFNLTNIIYKDDSCYFDIHYKTRQIKNIKFSIGGNHNLENALAASAMAILNDVDDETIKKSLETFSGVVRRFDIKIKTKEFIYIDDYAHHPSEIKAFLLAVKTIYPNKEITAVFQPHLYTRTRDFYKEFAESLSACNNLIIMPIYPAREKPIKNINSEKILENCTSKNKLISEKEDLIKNIKNFKPELLVTMGAGDIDQFVEPIKTEFGI